MHQYILGELVLAGGCLLAPLIRRQQKRVAGRKGAAIRNAIKTRVLPEEAEPEARLPRLSRRRSVEEKERSREPTPEAPTGF